jgi:alkylation response protein AidB-like acyl-CoA dehydrogenase
MTKLMWAETFRDLSDVYTDVVGAYYQAPELAPGVSLNEATTLSMWARSCTIWGGSSQVQRTIVAERVLGLPR